MRLSRVGRLLALGVAAIVLSCTPAFAQDLPGLPPLIPPVPGPVQPIAGPVLPPGPSGPAIPPAPAGQETMAGVLVDNIVFLFTEGAQAFVSTAQKYAKVIGYGLLSLELLFLVVDLVTAGGGEDVVRISMQWLLLLGLAAWAITGITGFANSTVTFISGMATAFSSSVGVPASLTPGEAISEGGQVVNALHSALSTSVLTLTASALGPLDPFRIMEWVSDAAIDIAFLMIGMDLALASIMTILAVDIGAIYVGFLTCRLTRGFALEYPRIIISAAMFQVGAHVIAGIGHVVATGAATTLKAHSGLFGTPDFGQITALGIALAILVLYGTHLMSRVAGGSALSSATLVGAGMGAWGRVSGGAANAARDMPSSNGVAKHAAEEDAAEWEAGNKN